MAEAVVRARQAIADEGNSLHLQLAKADQRIRELEEELLRQRQVLASLRQVIQKTYASPVYRLLSRAYRLCDRLCPVRSRRGQLMRSLYQRSMGLCQALANPRQRGEEPLRSINDGYRHWIAAHEPDAAELARQRQTHLAGPRISLLVHLEDPAAPALQELVHSVLAQTYPGWELCLIPAPGQDLDIPALLAQWNDPRIRVLPDEALAALEGEFLAIVGQHDTLAPFALFEVAGALCRTAEADLLYSDEDWLNAQTGQRQDPHFKPVWSPEAFRGHNYVGRLAVLRRQTAARAGGLGNPFEEAGYYDLLLRVSEQACQVVHLPRVHYHRREQPDRPASAAIRRVVQSHLHRLGLAGEVHEGPHPGVCAIRYPIPTPQPLVSIIIPTRDHPEYLARCVASIRRAEYSAVEVLIVENGSSRPETFDCYRRLCQEGARVLPWEAPFNYAAVNNYAARAARGQLLLFLNDDVEGIRPDWISRLVEHAVRPEVGAVGAKLLYSDDTLQHAGVVLGIHNGPAHYLRRFPRSSAGYGGRLAVVRELSAVTGACLMIRKEVFAEIGGFDEAFVIAFNDVDLCLQLGQKGYRVLWTPHSELYHFEYGTRGRDDTPEKQARDAAELLLFRLKWADRLEHGDPYYSPNLTVHRLDCSLRA
jgi:GT2 family glycosyltransferase